MIFPIRGDIQRDSRLVSEGLAASVGGGSGRFDLVFLDFSYKSEELEVAWALLRPRFVHGKTIVVINGLAL